MVRYGLKEDIKIDLTLLDDMNDFKNIIEGVLIKENFQIIGSWPIYVQVHEVCVTEALNSSPARLVRVPSLRYVL